MMKDYSKIQLLGILLILFAVGLFIDMIIGNFAPGTLIFAFVLILIGRKYRKKKRHVRGNVFLFAGALIFFFSLFASAAFALVIFACLAFFGYQLFTGKENPKVVQVEMKEESEAKQVYCTQPYIKNMMIGSLRMIDCVYELEDINIQYGIGDVEIDLTTAMIPEGETVVVIRGAVGNIRLYVPYDIELSLNHSVLVGTISLPGHEESGLNRNVILKTEQYKEAPRRIKIISSLFVGDTEVRKI
ncbi:cell wall-active antibiotics response protein LiaF [Bacillus manliponensis]|uniref:cell wall-active antibiotics response protein LiaF n=1 Tax=Bacillus manliponensis TaxID=574376 RepID=UPI0035117CF8